MGTQIRAMKFVLKRFDFKKQFLSYRTWYGVPMVRYQLTLCSIAGLLVRIFENSRTSYEVVHVLI